MGRAALGPAERQAIKRLLTSPKLEILPLRDVEAQLAAIPPDLPLTVTASPGKGLEASVALGERLRTGGREVVIHLAARMVADGAHLDRLLERMARAGLHRAFVVGGDADPPGEYPDAAALLRALGERGHHLVEIGIAGHPQGHPSIPGERLRAALAEKAADAQYVTTQLCFDVPALRAWVSAIRADGIRLPLEIGMPGAVDAARLLRISARIGVADAGRFVARHVGLVSRLLRPGGYRPDRLVDELAPLLADPDAGIRGLHVFTFNQLDQTEAWRRYYLADRTAD